MDEHRWKVGVQGEAVADRIGIKYQQDHLTEPAYIVGGTICNEEILRLAGEAEALGELEEEAAAEVVLLRRERVLLIELEKTRTRILASIFETGGGCSAEDVRQVGELLMAVEALHVEASGGVERPPGVGCACVLCRPEGDLRAEYNEYREAARTLGMREVKLSDLPEAARRMVEPGVGTCTACGDEREVFEGRCHDCISAGRRGKEG